MKWILMLVVLLAPATAAAQTNDVKVLERWVGTWSGKVTAKGCGDDGSRDVSFGVYLVAGGGLRSSGDALVDGIGDIDWSHGKKGLSAKTDGFTATLTGKGKVKLSLTTAGKCKVKATLKRRTSKIASCDRLDVLADIKSQCGIAGASDERAQIDADFAAWGKLTGKAKKAQDKQCKAQVTTLSGEVSSCGGGVATAGQWATGVAECDQLIARVMCMYDKTPNMPADAKKAFEDGIKMWKDGLANQATRAPIIDACKQSLAAAEQGFQAIGC